MYTFINVFLITLKHIAHYYYNWCEEDIYIYIYISVCVCMYLYYVYILYSFIYIGIWNSCYYNLYFCNLKMDLNLESFMKL